MSEGSVSTHDQQALAAAVTVYVNFGGQIDWLPRRINASQVIKKCTSYVSVEEDEDFTRPAIQAGKTQSPKYSAEAMKWVQDCVKF